MNPSVQSQTKKLALALTHQHNGNYRPDNLPFYGFDQLKKEFFVRNVFPLSTPIQGRNAFVLCVDIQKKSSTLFTEAS